MKKLKLSQVLVLLICSSMFVSACSKPKVSINVRQLKFTISLPANPTTGFQWKVVDYDKTLFKLVNGQYITSKIGVIGVGGKMIYTFHILKKKSYPSSSVIKFKYSRSWEPKSATFKDIKVHIKD
jgi:inhibitor of cysteine peptidase